MLVPLLLAHGHVLNAILFPPQYFQVSHFLPLISSRQRPIVSGPDGLSMSSSSEVRPAFAFVPSSPAAARPYLLIDVVDLTLFFLCPALTLGLPVS